MAIKASSKLQVSVFVNVCGSFETALAMMRNHGGRFGLGAEAKLRVDLKLFYPSKIVDGGLHG